MKPMAFRVYRRDYHIVVLGAGAYGSTAMRFQEVPDEMRGPAAD